MAFIHTEAITRACAELNPGESYVYNFPTPKDAHNEYCYFRTALRSAVQKNAAAKTLSLSRNGSSVVISMGYPAILYPTPSRVKTSTIPASQEEKSKSDLSDAMEVPKAVSPYQPILDRINADLAEGLISPDEAKEAIESLTTCSPSKED